jgi:hypothetical protein
MNCKSSRVTNVELKRVPARLGLLVTPRCTGELFKATKIAGRRGVGNLGRLGGLRQNTMPIVAGRSANSPKQWAKTPLDPFLLAAHAAYKFWRYSLFRRQVVSGLIPRSGAERTDSNDPFGGLLRAGHSVRSLGVSLYSRTGNSTAGAEAATGGLRDRVQSPPRRLVVCVPF